MIPLRKRLLNKRPVSRLRTFKVGEEFTSKKKKEKQGIEDVFLRLPTHRNQNESLVRNKNNVLILLVLFIVISLHHMSKILHKLSVDLTNTIEMENAVDQYILLHDGEEEQVKLPVLKLLEGQCLSPEFSSSPWPLDGSCIGDNTAYLRELRDQIAAEFKEKCKDLVVYGAALGEGYSAWMTGREEWRIGQNPLKSVQEHGTCFLQFITEDTQNNNDGDSKLLSFDGSQHLIVVNAEKMPYKNNRRNTKVLKFNPGLLFPWADRVIWQDAKLLSVSSIPTDYMLHFNSTVQDHNTCSSFVGLPHHECSTQNKTVTLKNHCDTVINVGQTSRPGVSDDINVIFTQCHRYEQKYKSNNTETKKSQKEVFHQNPLVETAFIVYDMRTEDCRKFNGDFGCSWLDEIHCYSDRDQVSFPQVLSSSGLHLSALSKINSTDDNNNYDGAGDRVYVDENDVPKIHIGNSSCHWYFENFAQCVSSSAPLYDYTLEYKP